MAQFARPDGDISTGSWTDEGTSFNDGSLWTSIEETSEDSDTSYILDAAANTTSEVSLTNVTDPAVGTGHILRAWMRSSGSGGPERLVLALFEGATQRATSGNLSNRSGTYGEVTYTLTAGEADAITAYTDLRIRLIASNQAGGEEVRVTQAEFEVPDVAAGDLSVNESDGLTVGETVTLELISFVSEADGLTVGEAVTVAHELDSAISESDGLTVGEFVDLEGVSFVSESDGLTVGDTATTFITIDIDVADNIVVVDLFLPYDSGIILAESVTISGLAAGDLAINVSDGLTVGEAVTVTHELDLAISETDGLTLGEFVDLELISFISVSDGLTIGDTATVVNELDEEINVSDGLTLAEAVTVENPTLEINESDSLTVGESVTVSIPLAGELAVSESDGLTVGEAVTVENPTDEISVSDGLIIGEAVTISGLGITDLNVNVSDGITVGELVKMHLVSFISEADGITLGEAVTVTNTTLFADVSDGLTIGETVTLDNPLLAVSESDGLTLGETVSVDPFAIGLLVSDALTIGETVSLDPVFPHNISIVDALIVDDTATVSFGFVGDGTVTLTLPSRSATLTLLERSTALTLRKR